MSRERKGVRGRREEPERAREFDGGAREREEERENRVRGLEGAHEGARGEGRREERSAREEGARGRREQRSLA